MKKMVALCAVVFLCLFPLPVIQASSFSSSPNDETAVHNDMKMFSCTFDGSNVAPTWQVTETSGTVTTVSSGQSSGSFNYPEITAIIDGGTIATLEVTADQALNGSMYRCRFDIIGGTVLSDPGTLTVYGKPLPPHVTRSGLRYISVRVLWDKPWASDLAPITEYKAELLNADGGVAMSDTIPASMQATEKTFDNLAQETAYSVRVAAVNSVDQSDWSPLVSFTTPLPNAPPAPTGLALTVTFAGTTPTVTASWTEPTVDPQNQTPVTGYTLSYKESSAADFIAVSHPDSITSYLIPNTEFGKTYAVKATASNDGGPSAETDAVSITAEYLQSVSHSAGVTSLNITCIFASSDLTLECAAEIVGPTAMMLSAPATGDPPTAHIMATGLEAGKYNYTVKATGADGAGSEYTMQGHLADVTATPTEPTEEPSEDPTDSESPSTDSTPTDPPTRITLPSGQSFTTTEIGIIAGVVVGVFLALVLVPCCIFSCYVLCRKQV